MADGPLAGLLIVDDHVAIAEAVAGSLRVEGFDPVVVAPSVQHDDVVAAAAAMLPAVAIVDLNLGAGAGGDGLIAPLHGLGTAVIVLTGVTEAHRLGACLRAGAAAVLDKAMPFDELVVAIRAVLDGDPAMAVGEREELLRAAGQHDRAARARDDRFAGLSPRERDVLRHLADGRTAAEIAAAEHVKLSTVRTHIQAVLSKLGVTSQQAAIALAHREGFDR